MPVCALYNKTQHTMLKLSGKYDKTLHIWQIPSSLFDAYIHHCLYTPFTFLASSMVNSQKRRHLGPTAQTQPHTPTPLLISQPSPSIHLPLPQTTPQTRARKTTGAQKAKLTTNLTARVTDPIRHLHLPNLHPHASLRNHMHDIDDSESAAAQGSEDRHGGDRPQDEFEVEVIRHVSAAVGFADGHGEHGVGDHPGHHHVGADGFIVVFLLLGLADGVLCYFEAVAQVAEGFVVAGVDVELFRGHFEFDGVALSGDGGAEVDVDYVVPFCAPGDVVGVAEGVDLEGADVGGKEGEVLG